MRSLIVISILTLVASCSPNTQPASSGSAYDENLSEHRPQVPEIRETEQASTSNEIVQTPYVEPTEHLRAELDSILRIKTVRNEEVGYLKGYTIQVYTGRSRDDANKAKNAVYSILTDQDATVTYDQPMFRVKVGQYYSRLEAEKSYYVLRDKFPQALVLPERIRLPE